METKYFSLGPTESSAPVKVLRIIFGLLCIGIAAYWAVYNVKASKSDATLWVTVAFLTAFGSYQIWAGLGRAARFIEIGTEKIILRQNSFLPVKELPASDLNKIEVYPLNLIFYTKNSGKKILRFGTTFIDIIEPIKIEVEEFASRNNVLIEIITEEI
jgi:hypothetical protein